MSYSLQWWLERLENPIKVSDGYTALCPAHNDVKNSLHLTLKDGVLLVHCFNPSCSYDKIVSAVTSGARETRSTPTRQTRQFTTKVDSRLWWQEYTQVSSEFWEELGTSFEKDSVVFFWEGSKSRKKRLSNSKNFSWESASGSPPLWPRVPPSLPETIWLTEGESDCGILRFLGYTSFTVTKGAGTPLSKAACQSLVTRGVRQIYFCYDLDSAGSTGAEETMKIVESVGIVCFNVDLSKIADVFLGEKDIRDLWKRVGDPEALKSSLELCIVARQIEKSLKVDLQSFLAQPDAGIPWRVQDIWLDETVGMIVGAPKMKKTWLALDLGLSIATGRPFLGTFPVTATGAVVYIPKEDPSYLLRDRISKILVSKDLGGNFKDNRIELPRRKEIPFYIDLERRFFFDPTETSLLISWLDEISQRHGGISLIIFDPILRMMSGIDEFKASEVGSTVFGTAERLQGRYKSGVLLTHHRSKSSEANKSSYGSVGFHAFSEGSLYIAGNEPDGNGWHHIRGEYKSAPETRWAYKFDGSLEQVYRPVVDRSDDVIRTQSLVSPLDAILSTLRINNTGMTVADLVRVLDGPSIYTIRGILNEQEGLGKVRREKASSPSGRGGAKSEVWFATD